MNKLIFTPSSGANAYYIKLRWDGTGSGGGGGGGGGGGTSDYNDLLNKPQINGVTLVGNKTLAQIGAIAAPSSPATGAFLVWNGTAWVAQTLSTWQGGNF